MKQLNGLINTRREEGAKNGDKPRNRPHGRRLGLAKEKPLPFPGKTKPIELGAIATDWLELHPENRTARLIYGYTKEEPDSSDENLAQADDEDEDEDENGVDDGARSHGDDDFLDPSLRSSGLVSADAEQLDEEDDSEDGG